MKLKNMMKTLKMNNQYYLAHPSDSRHEMRIWELGFEKRTGIQLFNPFYDDINRTDIEKIDAGRRTRYNQLNPSILVQRDIKHIAECRGVIAMITGDLSYGTIMEMVYGSIIYYEPVFSVVTNGHENHPWLKYHSKRIFTDRQKLEEFLIKQEEHEIEEVFV